MAIKFLSGLNLSNVTAGSILKLDSNGNIVAATAGTDYAISNLWTTTSSDIYRNSSVRIGTYQTAIAPDARLHVFDYQTTTPKLLIEDGNTGDASMQFKISTQQYTMGIDNSDSDKFVLAASSALGTTNALEISTTGVAQFGNDIKLNNGWTLTTYSTDYAQFSNWVNVENTGLFTFSNLYMDLDDSSSRFVIRGTSNVEQFIADTATSKISIPNWSFEATDITQTTSGDNWSSTTSVEYNQTGIKLSRTSSGYVSAAPYKLIGSFTASVSFKTSNCTHLGIIFAALESDQDNYNYGVILRNNSSTGTEVRVQKRVGGSQSYPIQAVNVTTDCDDGNWHELTVSYNGKHIVVDVDGTNYFDQAWTDTSFTSHGLVGLAIYDNTCQFNDFQVTETPSTTTFEHVNVRSTGDNGSAGLSDYGFVVTSSSSDQPTLGAESTGDGYANLNLGSNIDGTRRFWHISKRRSNESHQLEYYYYNGTGFDSKFIFRTDGSFFSDHLDLPSGGQLDWANGDARIVEGLVSNYSLSFQTYTGSALTTKMFIDSSGNVTLNSYGAGLLTTNANGVISLDTSTYLTSVDWSDIGSINGTINVNSTTQIGQGDTETLVSFQNSGTERGSFQVDDSANSYFVATGFKTATASTGFLKANGTVDTSTYLTSVAFSDITSKPTTLAGYGITDGATVDYVDTEVSGLASESWANTNLVNVTGDTMTGDLTIKRGHGDLTFLTLKQENTSGDLVEQKSFIDFTFVDSNTNETPQVRIGAEVGNNDGSASSLAEEGMGAFVVYTNNADTDAGAAGTSLAERFRVDYSGKVGIGTANPNYKLDVNGTLRATTLYSPIVRVSGSSDHLTLRSDVQVDQGATDPIIEFAYGTTQMGKFDQDGYMYATGFKTTTASTGLLKADGTVDTTTLGTMASESASDYKDSDTVESYVAQELASYTTTSSFGSNAFTSYTDHSTQGYLTSYTETDTLDSVTGRGATTTNNISVGNLTAVGGTFTDPVTIYDSTTTENPRLSVGRNSGESIQFSVTDVVNTITAKQDSDSDGDHTFVLDRVFAGAGDSAFSIHNDGTPDLTINGSGVVSFNQYNTAGILQVNTSGTISVDTSSYLTSYTETDTLSSVVARGASTTTAITTGGITADYGYFGSTSTAPQVRIYTENNTASIADTFTDTSTDKSYIYFNAGTNSNDPAYIMHETSESTSPDERNEGVLHLVPSDDNSTGDYVSIHGTNDPDCIKLHTSGLIETASNYQLQLKSGNASVKVDDTLHVTGRLYVDTLDANTTSTSALVEGGSGEIEARTLGSAAFSTATDFVAVGGDTVTGQITFPTAIANRPVFGEGIIARSDQSDTSGTHDIWGISERYYPSNSTAADAWGIQWSGTPNEINFIGAGQKKLSIDLDTAGTVKIDGNAVATESYVTTQISNLVDSAPAALDTLNELAAALGDDASFSTTMSTALGNRLRIDVSDQNLTATQKSNAITNLGLGTAATSTATDFVAVSGDTMTGTLKLDSELQFYRGSGSDYSNYIRAANYPSEGYNSTTGKYWLEYGAKGGHHFVVNTDGGSSAAENAYDDFTIWQGAVDGTRLFEVTNVGNVNVTGTLSATAKSFDIEHPTKEGKRLVYGSLEGAEHGVYFRGKGTGEVIELPEHWTGLVHEDSITVQLTPIGKNCVWVEDIKDNSVHVGMDNDTPYFYFIQAERKDIDKLIVEQDA